MIGFSAGGHLAAAVSTHFASRTYAPVDDADQFSCRPDFAIMVYPGHLWAQDDHVDGVEQSLAYYVALQKAGVPAEMHLYPQGGHALGVRPTTRPIGQWPHLVEAWLATLGVIAE